MVGLEDLKGKKRATPGASSGPSESCTSARRRPTTTSWDLNSSSQHGLLPRGRRRPRQGTAPFHQAGQGARKRAVHRASPLRLAEGLPAADRGPPHRAPRRSSSSLPGRTSRRRPWSTNCPTYRRRDVRGSRPPGPGPFRRESPARGRRRPAGPCHLLRAVLATLDLLGRYYTSRATFLKVIDWDVTLSLDVPLFQGGRVVADTKRAQSVSRQSLLMLEELEREALHAVSRLHGELVSAIDELSAQDEAAQAAEKATTP